MKRYDIINLLIDKYGYTKYCEIGTQNNVSFQRINVKHKTSVDPDPNSKADFVMPSDQFFDQLSDGVTYEIFFIDGLHHANQVYRDILNALDHLSEGGTIVLHDMLPTTKEMQQVPRIQKEWTGDCWKAFVRLRRERDDLDMSVVDTDYGCGIVRKGKQKRLDISDKNFNYKHFDKNRHKWMNIITVDEFLEKMGAKKKLKERQFKIWEFIPYDFDLDYGAACNRYFELVPDDDHWVAIRDTDIMSLTPAHMHKIRETIQKYPNTGLFTCLTNRVKQKKQIADMSLFDNPNVKVHRELALKLEKEPINAPVINYVISGYLMIMKKSTWKKIGGFPSGTLGVDNKVSYRVRQAGMDVRMMRNVYFFHYYRFNEGMQWRQHLKK